MASRHHGAVSRQGHSEQAGHSRPVAIRSPRHVRHPAEETLGGTDRVAADLRARPAKKALFVHTGGMLGIYAVEQRLQALLPPGDVKRVRPPPSS